jgi:hypothetical protein
MELLKRILTIICYVAIVPVSLFSFIIITFYGLFEYGFTERLLLIDYVDILSLILLPILILLAIVKGKKSLLFFFLPIIPALFLIYTSMIHTRNGIQSNIDYCEDRIGLYEKTISEGKVWNDISVEPCRVSLENYKMSLKKYK